MSRIRKCFIRGTTLEITFRTEEGLPLVPSPFMQLLLKSIFARAQRMYRVTVCHFVVMQNHVHMVIVVEDPQVVPDFVGYFKRESSHAVNRLTGRKKHTVWCNGYDSVRILDSEKAIQRIVYIYTNPQRAYLEISIDKYPNLSSWGFFLTGGGRWQSVRISRKNIPELPQHALKRQEQEQIAQSLLEGGTGKYEFVIESDAWMSCFADLDGVDPKHIRDEIIRRVREEEAQLDRERTRPVMGAEALMQSDIRASYIPKKRGLRMLCLSSCQTLRKNYIAWYRDLCVQAQEILARWRTGDWMAILPPGMFAPGQFLRANLNPALAP